MARLGDGFPADKRRDSYMSCDKVLRLRWDEVLREITAIVHWKISEAVREQAVAAVKFATTLSADEKQKILASLAGW